MPHIQIARYASGVDYIIGDIHGNAALFKCFLDNLIDNHDARVYIDGDLFDKGSDPVGVYKLILQYQKQIFVSRGNHEDMLLDACKPNATKTDIVNFLRNGGLWILQNSEEKEELIECFQWKRVNPNNNFYDDLVTIFRNAPKIPELEDILAYVNTLPYIVLGNGFVLCHSDLIFDDQELEKMTTLTPSDITYLTWARKSDSDCDMDEEELDVEEQDIVFQVGKRNEKSKVVYCGHTIISDATEAIRKQTNHINLDVGAFRNHYFVVVNHTERFAFLVSNGFHSKVAIAQHQLIAKSITDYLHDIITVPEKKQGIRDEIQKIKTCLNELTVATIKISPKNQNLLQALSHITAHYDQWLSDPNSYQTAIESTQGALSMVMMHLNANQCFCLFNQYAQASLLRSNVVKIQSSLEQICIHFGKFYNSTDIHQYKKMA